MKTKPILALVGAVALLAAPAMASELWLHVRVDEEGGAKVSVNLPLDMIEAVLPMIPEEHFHGGRVVIDDYHWTPERLREAWQEIKNSPDMAFVTVEDHDEQVRISKQGDYMLVRVQDRVRDDHEAVDVKIPVSVVDALLSGDRNELDLAAAIEALAAHGEGELVTVTGGRDRVRVWIDRDAEAE